MKKSVVSVSKTSLERPLSLDFVFAFGAATNLSIMEVVERRFLVNMFQATNIEIQLRQLQIQKLSLALQQLRQINMWHYVTE